jgi:hypothetical protein
MPRRKDSNANLHQVNGDLIASFHRNDARPGVAFLDTIWKSYNYPANVKLVYFFYRPFGRKWVNK